jgi:hypothetical protein
MKTSIWDILTGIILLAILCMIVVFAAILLNPNIPLNPLPPTIVSPANNLVPTVALPTATMTVPGLPPTWTPVPTKEDNLPPSPKDTPAPAPTSGGGSLLRPSSTPVPTNTIVILPTFTPSKTTRAGVGGGSCSIVYQEPQDGTSMTKGKGFDTRWTIKNTSGKDWRADSVDIRFMSGDRMHSGNDLRDMPYDVGSGGMLDLVVSMTAPATAGSYTSNWALVQGNTSVCNFYVQIRVP